METDQKFLEDVVRSLVDNADAVSVERNVDEMGVLLTLKVDPTDMGQIIGRQGQTARAIRTLLRVVGAKNNARVNLKIYEPEGSERPPRREDAPREAAPAATPEATPAAAPEAAPVEEIDTSVVDDLKL
jgi:uncharacterized protein